MNDIDWPVTGLSIEQQPGRILHRMLLWGEARGEHDDGGTLESAAMAAVAFVPLNRMKRSRWMGRELPGVILEPWAFSCFNQNDPNRVRLLDAPRLDAISWERADTICDLIEAGLLTDPTHGATHYCVSTLWNRPPARPDRVQWYEAPEILAGRTRETVAIGHHVFAIAP